MFTGGVTTTSVREGRWRTRVSSIRVSTWAEALDFGPASDGVEVVEALLRWCGGGFWFPESVLN